MKTNKKSITDNEDIINDVDGGKFKIIEYVLQLLQKYGFTKVIMSVLVVFFITTMSILVVNEKEIITSIVDRQKKESVIKDSDNMSMRLRDITPKVDSLLLQLLFQTNADRVFILEMHNGTDNPTGLPFVYGEVTYERVTTMTIENLADGFGKLTLSRYPMASYIFKNIIWNGDIKQMMLIDQKLAYKFEEFGDKYVYICGMSDRDRAIGCLVLSYVEKPPRVNDNIVRGWLTHSSQKISILLDLENNVARKVPEKK